MNAKHRKYLIGAAMVAITLPAMGFAARDAFTGSESFGKRFRNTGTGTESGWHRGPGSGKGFGMAVGPMGGIGMEKLLKDEQTRAALAASGVILPSTEEIRSYAESMKAAREAQAKLSDADKAELKKLHDEAMEKMKQVRESAAKAERDFLRSKGVNLPSEETIAKMRSTMEKAGEVLKSNAPRKGFGPKNGRGGNHQGRGGHEGRGGFGEGREMRGANETL